MSIGRTQGVIAQPSSGISQQREEFAITDSFSALSLRDEAMGNGEEQMQFDLSGDLYVACHPDSGKTYDCSNSNYNFMSYPDRLLGLSVPPDTIFAIGNPDALSLASIALIGSRKASPYGYRCVERFTDAAISQGLAIVTGGALGIEAMSMRRTLELGGFCVCVLGGGLAHPYPNENIALFQMVVDNGGLIISEQSWQASPTPHMFRFRHRLIGALCNCGLVIESGLPSGSFSLADNLLASGKPLLAVPGNIDSRLSSGPNALISAGAIPVFDESSFEGALRQYRVLN